MKRVIDRLMNKSGQDLRSSVMMALTTHTSTALLSKLRARKVNYITCQQWKLANQVDLVCALVIDYDKKNVLDTLELIRNKGNCQRTVQRAQMALSRIRGSLSGAEYNELSTELNHVELGEGADMLNDVLARVIKRFEDGV